MADIEKLYFLRDVLGEYLNELGNKNDKVVVVNADLMGTCRNGQFVKTYPDRAFNVGIAEQNMISFSAGLAHEGYIPYAFSMAPFISMRACEQCRTDVAYGNLTVRLISAYAGVSGGISGATHWGIEDVAIMGAIPNMVVMEPCDPIQAIRMLEATLEYNGPIYIRSSVEPVKAIYTEKYKFKIGKASIARKGNDGTFICSGITVKYAVEAAEKIKKDIGKQIRVLDMHTIKPIDKMAVIEAAKTKNVIVAQDHNRIGGLGYAVAEVIAEERLAVNFLNLGIPDQFFPMAHAPYLYHEFKLDAEGLYGEMKKLIIQNS